MTRAKPNQCPTCGERLTVKHIIYSFQNYRDTNDSFAIANNLHGTLEPNPSNIKNNLKFLKLTKL